MVTQLSASHDRIVTEYNPLSTKHLFVGNQLHFGHQLPHLLIRRGEAAGPGRRIFDKPAFIGDSFAGGVSERHTDTRIWNAGYKIGFDFVVFTHLNAAIVTHLIDILALVFTNRIAVVNPQEGADLHLFARFAQLGIAVGRHLQNFSRADKVIDIVSEIIECATL